MCETDRDDDLAAGNGHRSGDGTEAPTPDPGAWCAIANVRREMNGYRIETDEQWRSYRTHDG